MTNTGPIPNNLEQGELEIDDISMHTPAWSVLDLLPLWQFPATRGENILIPAVDGMLPTPRLIDQTTVQLEIAITGAVNLDGEANANPMIGLQENIDYLNDNIGSPPPLPDTTRPALLTMPDGSMRSADVQCVLLLRPLAGHDVDGLLVVTIPAGRFVLEGS